MAFKWLGLWLLVLCLVDNLHAHFGHGLRETCSTGLRSGVCKPKSDCPYHKRIDGLFHHTQENQHADILTFDKLCHVNCQILFILYKIFRYFISLFSSKSLLYVLKYQQIHISEIDKTRTHSASFSNGVVFPGGVSEDADASEHWLQLLSSFGFGQNDFEGLHRPGAPSSPIFAIDPVRRHIALRITAIRETFEELGLLLCSGKRKADRSGVWADILSGVDVQHWRSRVSKDPAELLNLCKQHNCYPDIWALHYWSNWLTPANVRVRFDTAFFVAALKEKPSGIQANSEVVKVEWETPLKVLKRNRNKEVQLYPPQGYELHRLSKFHDVEQLAHFAKKISCEGNELLYPILLRAKDGVIHVLPGDYRYPPNVDLDNPSGYKEDNKTILELRDTSQTLHRFETSRKEVVFVTQNYTPKNHINMDDQVMQLNVTTIH